jgi:hypothetical protein
VFVFDSATNLWSLLKNLAQSTANARAAAKARKYNKSAPADDVQITMDLWNHAASQWFSIVHPLIQWSGIVIFTARGKEVAKLDSNGKPVAGEKDYSIEGHKTLPFDADIIVRTTAPSEAILTGFRSVWVAPNAAMKPVPNYATDGLSGLLFDVLKLGADMGTRDLKGAATADSAPLTPLEAPTLPTRDAKTHLADRLLASGVEQADLATVAPPLWSGAGFAPDATEVDGATLRTLIQSIVIPGEETPAEPSAFDLTDAEKTEEKAA